MRHSSYYPKRSFSFPCMQHRIRFLSLCLLCFIGSSALVWSQNNADETPISSPSLPQQPDSPAADVSPSADASLSSVFLHGYHAFQDKDWEAARTAFEHGQQHEPLLADYSLYFLGELHLKASRPVEARAVFERLWDEYPATVWRSDAALALAQLTFAEERWERTLAYAKQAQQAPLVTDTVRHQCALLIAQPTSNRGSGRLPINVIKPCGQAHHERQSGERPKPESPRFESSTRRIFHSKRHRHSTTRPSCW